MTGIFRYTAAVLSRFSGVLVLTLCQAAAAQPYKAIVIGTTQSLTAHYQEFGIEQLRGLQMWVADVNARGALLGRPVELLHYDDRSRDAGTVEGFKRLIEQDGVDFLVGPYSSSLTLEASLVAEQYNIPMVATAASSEEIWSRGLRNIFGVDTPAKNYVTGLELAVNAGAKSIAMVYANTEFPVEVAGSVRSHALSHGLKMLLDESYEPEERDFSALVQRLAAVNADVVLGVSYLEDSVEIVREVRRQQLKPKMLVFTVGPALREFGDLLGADAEGVLGVVQWLRSVPVPGAEDFAYRYRRRYGSNPAVHAAIGYSAGQILEAAIRLAGTIDHDAVREQLRSMYFRSLFGRYQVDDTGRQIGKRNYVLQWQNNQRRLVAPVKLAERALVYPLL